MKGGKYTKTLAKNWVEGIIRLRDIRGNVLPKFIEPVVWRRHAGAHLHDADGNQQKHLLTSFATKA